MADYHVSAGIFGIYAGIFKPKKDGKPQEWKDKSCVTQEAICAVRDYMVSDILNEKAGVTKGGYMWTRKDGKKIVLSVEVVEE